VLRQQFAGGPRRAFCALLCTSNKTQELTMKIKTKVRAGGNRCAPPISQN
jgi:hypothetical protein